MTKIIILLMSVFLFCACDTLSGVRRVSEVQELPTVEQVERAIRSIPEVTKTSHWADPLSARWGMASGKIEDKVNHQFVVRAGTSKETEAGIHIQLHEEETAAGKNTKVIKLYSYYLNHRPPWGEVSRDRELMNRIYEALKVTVKPSSLPDKLEESCYGYEKECQDNP